MKLLAISHFWKVKNISDYFDNIKLLKFDKILLSLNIFYIIKFFISKHNFGILSRLQIFKNSKI